MNFGIRKGGPRPNICVMYVGVGKKKMQWITHTYDFLFHLLLLLVFLIIIFHVLLLLLLYHLVLIHRTTKQFQPGICCVDQLLLNDETNTTR